MRSTGPSSRIWGCCVSGDERKSCGPQDPPPESGVVVLVGMRGEVAVHRTLLPNLRAVVLVGFVVVAVELVNMATHKLEV